MTFDSVNNDRLTIIICGRIWGYALAGLEFFWGTIR
jgi:hypothetical protein